jgi:hypothetical protein
LDPVSTVAAVEHPGKINNAVVSSVMHYPLMPLGVEHITPRLQPAPPPSLRDLDVQEAVN